MNCKQKKDLEHLPGVRPTMCRKIRQKGHSSRSMKYKPDSSILLLYPTFCIKYVYSKWSMEIFS